VIHLNTASLGATPRVVLDRTLAAWRELESSPVLMAYGNAENTVLSAADRVRKRAAGFLGCKQDELLITRCTTDAMSTVAQGMHWTAGEHVLTTDREHDGGSLCWTYIAQRHGVVVDRAVRPVVPRSAYNSRTGGGYACARKHRYLCVG